MGTPESELTLTNLIRGLWPILDGDERDAIATARQTLSVPETWEDNSGVRTETSYRGQAHAALRELSISLRAKHPWHPAVVELYERYGRVK